MTSDELTWEPPGPGPWYASAERLPTPVLARELGLTAVIGVPGLLDRVRDGDQVEVDPVAGTITVLGSSPAT